MTSRHIQVSTRKLLKKVIEMNKSSLPIGYEDDIIKCDAQSIPSGYRDDLLM